MMKTQKNYLGSNLKFLRERKKKTQTEIANSLGVTRAKINAFENGVNSNPTVDDLGKFTGFFKISVDSLLWVNLKRLGELQLRNLEAGNDEYVMGTKIRVLATTVDPKNRDNIEIVPIKAKAGYANGYHNTEYIESLQSFHLPVLSKQRKYRMFQVEGDSMFPIPDKSFIIAEYIENWFEIKDNQPHVILTKDEGIVFKIVFNKLRMDQTLLLHSLNPTYHDYSVKSTEIREVWKFVSYISDEVPNSTVETALIGRYLNEIRNDIDSIKLKIKA